MPAFLAFLDHIHGLLTATPHNTPIVLMASAQWTRTCCETVARYIFEKTKTPALCMINSAIATQYGLRFPHMTVVDIGFEKVDVTCLYDTAVVNHMAIGSPAEETPDLVSGGEVFTRNLMRLLKEKNFTHDMAEQLKRSHICEVLPYVPELKERMELPKEVTSGQQQGTTFSSAVTAPEAPRIVEPVRVSGLPTDVDDGTLDEPKPVDADGVLDIATIVTSGNTKEFISKREKEKEKTTRGKKGKEKEGETQGAKAQRLPNSKRTHNMFHYEEIVQEEVPKTKPAPPAPIAAPLPAPAAAPAPVEKPDEATEAAEPTNGAPVDATNGAPAGGEAQAQEPKRDTDMPKVEEMKIEDALPAPAPTSDAAAAGTAPAAEPASVSPPTPDEPAETEIVAKRVRRDVEVGLERFLFADRDQIDRITTLIWRTIQGIPDMYMRPACWDHIAIVGNGSRIRGLKENILQTLNARHLISPSSATMFTSELPSNIATPSGTGAQTPTGSFTGAPHQLPGGGSSGVNPLLQAATTASLSIPAAAAISAAASDAAGGVISHHFHSQTPTSIKTAPTPTYLAEWSKNGFEESMFLGAQVAGRMAFTLHNLDPSNAEAQRLMSLTRVDYK